MMIKILTGPEGYSNYAYMQNDGFIDLVQKNWRNRLQATWSGSSLEAYCHQVKICAQMALNCVEEDSQERPDIVKIIDALNEIERNISKNILLQVEPIKLQFLEEADSSHIACSLQLTNNTDKHVIFRLVTKNPEYFKGSFCGVVTRGEKYSLAVTRCNKLLKPQVDRDEYLTLESSMASDHEIQYAISDHVDSHTRFFVEAIETGREIHRVKLTGSYIPAQGKAPTKSTFIQKRSIHDNFLYVQGAVRKLHRQKIPALLLKLDIHKAFDSVN
ncbi:uncharacterized protein [Miscanthus floridulus]|uniref:uncharacterized protein isoform X1 n=1 Tax=Miscanthus floridulus TaxID=154761 RepID=UPI0034591DCE